MEATQGLWALYGKTGRRTEWGRLVEHLTPDMVHLPGHPHADQPLPGRETDWSVFTGYRIGIARENRDWPTAQRLQHLVLDRDRQDADAALGKPAAHLDDTDRNRIRNLGIGLFDLAWILREQGDPDCIPYYREAIDLARRIRDHRSEAIRIASLGHAYLDIPTVRDLDQAETSYQTSLDLYTEDERVERARNLAQLGRVALLRYYDARDAGQPDNDGEQLGHLNTARTRYQDALDLTPADAPGDLDMVHGQLGIIYAEAARFDAQHLDTALHHC